MDPDNNFSPVELIIPAEDLKKDEDLQKKIAPPEWNVYAYVLKDSKSSDCKKTKFKTEAEAFKFFKDDEEKDHKVIMSKGNILKSSGQDQVLLGKCMGQAVFDGNLKRKSFVAGYYYVANQTDLANQSYNMLTRFKTLDAAKESYKNQKAKGYSKILVEGTTGRIMEKDGPKEWVG